MKIVDLVARVFASLKKHEWIPILLVRLALGYEFAISGWGKIHHLDKLTAYFAALHIPMCRFQRDAHRDDRARRRHAPLGRALHALRCRAACGHDDEF